MKSSFSRSHFVVLNFFLIFLFLSPFSAQSDDQICIYSTDQGKVVQVNSREQVPVQYKGSANCFKPKTSRSSGKRIKRDIWKVDRSKNQPRETYQVDRSGFLAKPEEMNLSGTIRKESMASSLGRIELRWPRKIEVLFGRTPKRAMADAARTASRALKSAGFPPQLRTLDLDWKVVFLDAELPRVQIPSFLINNCHPAWMTAPSNMYFVGQRIVSGCGEEKTLPGRVADAKLAQVILHEMGHVIEYQILKGIGSYDRARSEGFATWFEQYAADYSSIISRGKVSAEHLQRARDAIKRSPHSFHFTGSAHDYSRASMIFRAVVAKRRISGLMKVYQTIREKRLSFVSAVKETFHWSDKKFKEEILKAAGIRK